MTTRAELNGTDCLQASSPILCGPGTRTVIVVVPHDAAKELCTDGAGYDCKAIVFCNGECMSVKCIMRTDLPRVRASAAGMQATVDVLTTLPETLAIPISCPPPGLTAVQKQERLDAITKWMRDEYKATSGEKKAG